MNSLKTSLKKLQGRIKKTMKLLRDWYLVIIGFIFAVVMNGLTVFINDYSRLTGHGLTTVLWNIAITVVVILLIGSFLLFIMKQISGIDNKEKEETKSENAKRDSELITAFKNALKENNADLAQEIKKALGKG